MLSDDDDRSSRIGSSLEFFSVCLRIIVHNLSLFFKHYINVMFKIFSTSTYPLAIVMIRGNDWVGFVVIIDYFRQLYIHKIMIDARSFEKYLIELINRLYLT